MILVGLVSEAGNLPKGEGRGGRSFSMEAFRLVRLSNLLQREDLQGFSWL